MEVIVAVSIILLVLSSIYGVHVFYIKTVFSNLNKVRATFLLEEGMEAVKLVRDSDWVAFSNVPVATNRFLSFDGSSWQIVSTNTFVDSLFERKVVLTKIKRDTTSGTVGSGGGVFDDGTRKVIVTVSWKDGTATTSRSMSTYVTNFAQ